MLISTETYIILKNGSKKYKSIEDLHKPSNYRLLVKCENCLIEYEKLHSNWVRKKYEEDYCKSCIKLGDRNPVYGKDRKDLLDYARTFQKINGMQGREHSIESKQKMSEIKSKQIAEGTFNIKSNNRGRKGFYYSLKNKEQFYYDSLLEKFRMIKLDEDNNVISWTKKHKIRIPYIFKNIERYCIPDFKIQYNNNYICIEEVKGLVTEQELIKKEAIKLFCDKHNYIFKFTSLEELNENYNYRKFIKQENNNEAIS